MNKPVISAVVISVACTVGFIFGFLFNELYQVDKNDLVYTAVAQQSKADGLLGTFTLLLTTQLTLQELGRTTSLEGVESLTHEYEERVLSHKSMFKIQLEEIRKDRSNPDIFYGLDEYVDNIEDVVRMYTP